MGKEEKKKMEQKDELTNSDQRFPVEQVSAHPINQGENSLIL